MFFSTNDLAYYKSLDYSGSFMNNNNGKFADSAPLKLAAFDVDGTLTFTDSFTLFLRFFAGKYKYFLNMIMLAPVFILYVLKIIDRDTTKNRLLARFFKGVDYDYYKARCVEFSAKAYPLIIRQDGLAKINNHLGIKDEVALVSASIEDYLLPFAASIGVSHVIATKLEVIDGKLSGKMLGPNCRAQEKLNRIRAYFGECEIIAAYGDSRGDKEMIDAAKNKQYRTLIDEPRNAKQIINELYFGNLMS